MWTGFDHDPFFFVLNRNINKRFFPQWKTELCHTASPLTATFTFFMTRNTLTILPTFIHYSISYMLGTIHKKNSHLFFHTGTKEIGNPIHIYIFTTHSLLTRSWTRSTNKDEPDFNFIYSWWCRHSVHVFVREMRPAQSHFQRISQN